jgi:phosphatidylserine decarboxylase
MHGSTILVWDRKQERMIAEKIQDESILRFLYGSAPGRWAANAFFSRKIFSRLYAARFTRARSVRMIERFISRYAIDAGNFEQRSYTSFNEFFARRFRPGARTFAGETFVMPAFAEGRYLAWEAAPPELAFAVKGRLFTVQALLGGEEEAAAFRNGPVIICRLAPQDYHRVHFIDSGRIIRQYRKEGPLHSVNPIALSSLAGILSTNAREITIQETAHFGRVAYVEVGAMTVGRIIQHCGVGANPARGEEKSHFEYGASTVVVLGQPGRWKPDPGILDRTRQGIETFVELGTAVAHAATG